MPRVSHSTGTNGRSPTFPGTLEHIITEMKTLEDDVLEENEATFKQLIQFLVPLSTRLYIFQFLVEHGFKQVQNSQ
jgi:hypothetical protein